MSSLDVDIYPYDIFGIKKIGIEKWLSNYYLPVSGTEFEKIEAGILQAYIKGLNEYDNEDVYWILVSNLKIPMFISVYILYLLRFIRLKECGYKYMIGREQDRISIEVSDFDLTRLDSYGAIDSSPFCSNLRNKGMNFLRVIKNNCIDTRVFANISNPHFLIGNKNQYEVAHFCNEYRVAPIYITPALLFKKYGNKERIHIDLDKLLDFTDKFIDVVVKKYPFIGNNSSNILKRKISDNFQASYLFYRRCRDICRKVKHKTLLATGLGNKVNRLFCAAWMSSGNDVVGFAHGNSYCNSYHNFTVIKDGMSVVNRYFAASQGQRKLLNEVISRYSYGMKMPNVEYSESNYYRPLFQDLQKASPVRGVKRIMIIGSLLKNSYYPLYCGHHAFVNYELELRLAKVLKSAGYYVIYKAHPDSINEIEGLFDGYVDEILTGRFEDVFLGADCIVYKVSRTTTFGFALLTNRPIVLLNVNGAPWFSKAFELLKKRCCIVDADYRDDRIVFDEKDLIDAVKSSPENIDYKILHEFAF